MRIKKQQTDYYVEPDTNDEECALLKMGKKTFSGSESVVAQAIQSHSFVSIAYEDSDSLA